MLPFAALEELKLSAELPNEGKAYVRTYVRYLGTRTFIDTCIHMHTSYRPTTF